jgi:hypothetical protein
LGLTPLKAREWLNERGIIQNTVYAKEDLAHA